MKAIDPWRNATHEVVLEGELSLSKFSRLAEELADQDGVVAYNVRFYKDEERRACAKLDISTVYSLICQRCLERCPYEVKRELLVSFVTGELEVERLPEHLEPVLVVNDEVSLVTLLEDELLLALPHVPMHEDTNCNGQPVLETEELVDENKTENPFAVLASLKAESGKQND